MLIKRLTLVALCSAGLAVAASAQRGGGGAHGSVGGHAGSAMGGGFGPSASHSISSVPRLTGSRPLTTDSRSFNTAPAYRANYSGAHGPRTNLGLNGSNAYRRPYNGYRGRGPYLNGPWAGWNGATFIGYPGFGLDNGSGYSDDSAYAGDNQPAYTDSGQGPYGAPELGQPMPYPAYPQDANLPAYPQPPIAPAPEPQPEDAVTLIFKDGRPAQQIHNYMLTRTTLYVHDQHHREIALSELDLAATKRANKDEGVDFQLLPETTH